MDFFDNIERLFIWGLTFCTIAYVLWRWGRSGFPLLVGGGSFAGLGELFKMLWSILIENPVFMALLSLACFLGWLFFS